MWMKHSEDPSDLKNTPGSDRVSGKQVSVMTFADRCQASARPRSVTVGSVSFLSKISVSIRVFFTDLFSPWILQRFCRSPRRTT